MDEMKKVVQQPNKAVVIGPEQRAELLNSLTLSVADVKSLSVVMAKDQISPSAIDAMHSITSAFMAIAMAAPSLSQEEINTMFNESDILADTKLEEFFDFLKRVSKNDEQH
jgi:hypothetical protein